MEEERRGGAVEVRLMTLDSSDAARQQGRSLMCVRVHSSESGTSHEVSRGQGHITDITSPPEPPTQLCKAGRHLDEHNSCYCTVNVRYRL